MKRCYLIENYVNWDIILEQDGFVIGSASEMVPNDKIFFTYFKNILKSFRQDDEKIKLIFIPFLETLKDFKKRYKTQGNKDFDKIFQKGFISILDVYDKKYSGQTIQSIFPFFSWKDSTFRRLCNFRIIYRNLLLEQEIERPRKERHHAKKVFSEKSLQIKVMGYLKTLKNSWWLKTNSRLQKGIPDIIGCYKGQFFAFELKRKGKNPSPFQNLHIAKITSAEGVAIKIDDLNQIKNILIKFLRIKYSGGKKE